MEVVVFPDPAGIPEVAVTRISLPLALEVSKATLALSLP